MAIWQVQEAKTRLSKLIEDAWKDGPQFITKHGAERRGFVDRRIPFPDGAQAKPQGLFAGRTQSR